MKSVIKICDMNALKDVTQIQNCMAQIQGIIACEISLEKKELQVIYNESFVDLETIINSIENLGFLVI
ncbi:ferredoxin [Clostridium sp. HCP1S3_B4]|uniref:ferredoxin n=1 Tax=unclassified Clostridium TaxID=2614128 RepID=UPI0016997FFA|nr:ferredoxin [Clostridium sp.]MDD5794628.1 ferredoxin [Clostridiales bacterium]MDY2729384.1 ferredoxin [Clostridium sp.]NLK22502.1 heavy-metal-associated domain-containing protein [Clostridiales bacterium]